MSHLEGKKILLAITGGIAAYKMNYLIRDLVKAGAEVKVLITPTAGQFVSALTLSTLSKNPVLTEMFDDKGTWNNHVELALWADLMLVAPCTANTLSKMVHGICDNLVLATYLSAKCPIFIAPAMDLDMYQHFSTQQNLEIAQDQGHIVIPAEEGELASGLVGPGRLASNETIVNEINRFFAPNKKASLAGKKILITAGPTYEAIDPVRFIGNHSSGKMGYALAEEAAERGALVTLISGPSSETVKHSRISLCKVTSAREMYDEVFKYYEGVDVAIAAAAVADYAPKEVAAEKIKKSEDAMTIGLVKNPDILKAMGEQKKHQFLVGFALETQNEEANAQSKLVKKNLDMIILNSLRDKGAGFQKDTNRIKIITHDDMRAYELKTKQEVASDILDFMESKINSSH